MLRDITPGVRFVNRAAHPATNTGKIANQKNRFLILIYRDFLGLICKEGFNDLRGQA